MTLILEPTFCPAIEEFIAVTKQATGEWERVAISCLLWRVSDRPACLSIGAEPVLKAAEEFGLTYPSFVK